MFLNNTLDVHLLFMNFYQTIHSDNRILPPYLNKLILRQTNLRG